jgi:hypothetical protein
MAVVTALGVSISAGAQKVEAHVHTNLMATDRIGQDRPLMEFAGLCPAIFSFTLGSQGGPYFNTWVTGAVTGGGGSTRPATGLLWPRGV